MEKADERNRHSKDPVSPMSAKSGRRKKVFPPIDSIEEPMDVPDSVPDTGGSRRDIHNKEQQSTGDSVIQRKKRGRRPKSSSTIPSNPLTVKRGVGRPKKLSPSAVSIPVSPDIPASLLDNGALRKGRPRKIKRTADVVTDAEVRELIHCAGEVMGVNTTSSMDAVVKVFCVHTKPNFSLPWQRKRQYSSSSTGFIISGKRVLTNAHSVEHHTQVKLKKRGSDTKYLATVLAIGTECDIGELIMLA